MNRNVEQILIIHSVEGTSTDDVTAVGEAISDFSSESPRVKIEPHVMEVPGAAAPGATLGTELKEQLTASIGAVVFVDDLRPNVVYELGFVHGQGRVVLLLTRKRIDSVWSTISDLAGAALVSLESVDVKTAVHSYLDRLYSEISRMRPWPMLPLPSAETNLLSALKDSCDGSGFSDNGPYGPTLTVKSFDGRDFSLGFNLFPGAKFIMLLRADSPKAQYTVYFRVHYSDRRGRRSEVWLGLSSHNRLAGLTYHERTFPAQSITGEWRVLTAEFNQLLKQGLILGVKSVDFLEKIRFRAGRKHEGETRPVDIGYLTIIGADK